MPNKRKVEITEGGYQKLCAFIAKVNVGGSGRIRMPDVLEHAVHKLNESDVETVQENYYSPSDKIELLLHQLNQKREGDPLTKEQLLASMLEAYQKTPPPKSIKTPSKKEV